VYYYIGKGVGSSRQIISDDGRFVVFSYSAYNRFPGDTHIPGSDPDVVNVFVRDRVNGTTERISVSPGNGTEMEWLSIY